MAKAVARGFEVRKAYSEWLQGYFWDDFLTVTFREPRKDPYYALSAVWGQLQLHNVSRAFLASEPFQCGGDVHIHGIVAGRGPGWRPEVELPWDIWQGLFKRFGRSKVEACNSTEAVAGYCSKYVLKQQQDPSDFYGVFGHKFAWQDGKLPPDLTVVV